MHMFSFFTCMCFSLSALSFWETSVIVKSFHLDYGHDRFIVFFWKSFGVDYIQGVVLCGVMMYR